MRYRKRPITVEAVQVRPENDAALLDFFNRTGAMFHIVGPGTFVIHTLEGNMTARPNDWLIEGVQGEVYPCKPDIFEATYEPVDDSPDATTL